MDKVQQRKGKKPRVKSPSVRVKQEVPEEEQPSGGAGAMVAVEVAAPIVEVTVRIEKAKLHCPICKLPFKPPIFQCIAGHPVCGVCHDQLPDKEQCSVCGLAGAYGRSTLLEDMVQSTRIPCPYDAYGCRSYVIYHAAGEHQDACPWAPCRCSEPGCGFVGSPPMLRDHLRDAHAWLVDKVRYGQAHHIRLRRRRLLDAEDDGRVFLVYAGAHGGGARRDVAVACVRAAAAPVPQYFCKMWVAGSPGPATGRVQLAAAEVDVPSISSVPGDADAAADAAPLSVARSMLHGESMEMRLSVRIEKPKK
ncbi:unnamed protein product [Urochloa humidicola]